MFTEERGKKKRLDRESFAFVWMCFFAFILVMVSIGFTDHVGRVLFTVCVWMTVSHHRRPFLTQEKPCLYGWNKVVAKQHTK